MLHLRGRPPRERSVKVDHVSRRIVPDAASLAHSDGRGRWWESRWTWLALAICSLFPFLLSPLPPLGDLFSHMARYHVMLDGERSPYLQRYFQFRWDILPNLGQDILMLAAGPLLGVERGALFLSAMLPPALILLVRELSKAMHGVVQPTALLALPFAYSFTYLYGFMNYQTGLVMVLAAMLFWLRSRQWRAPPRIVVLVLFAFATWVAHIAAWAILLVAIGSFELVSAIRRHGWTPMRVVGAVLPVMGPMALPALITLARWRPGGSAETTENPLFHLKFYWLAFPLRDEVRLLDLASLAIIAAVPLVLLLTRRLKVDAGLTLAAVILFVLFWLLPTDFMGGFYADLRLLPVIWVFVLIACRVDGASLRQAQMTAAVALALFAVRLAATTHGWMERGTSLQAELGALKHVPVGARIAQLSPARGCHGWANSGINHLASLAIVRRDAFTSTQWDIPGQQLMQPIHLRGSRYNTATLMRPEGSTCGEMTMTDWLAGLPRDRFDFVWLFTARAPANTRGWLKPLYYGPKGTLYAIERGPR